MTPDQVRELEDRHLWLDQITEARQRLIEERQAEEEDDGRR